ncbi:hypothetical protein [Streptomyces justiciae]|uniref:Uncharacterized protein n=1 Tax=Streptomyces justiciae TaxID=2780140 RepID=A0ABU3M6U6_9ACTN|nr:hypothetical protein [Streptomyces justiciae]MDT7847245.1 hypothetical protein [Streptomyces justiciae]
MTARTLPHDDYIEAVYAALENAGLPVQDAFTEDSETRGLYCYLNAVITIDLVYTSHGEDWPHGLLFIWEWHTGIEADQGEPDRGPVWLFAEAKSDGSNEYPTVLPVYGYASPAAVVQAARKVIAREIGPGSFNGISSARWDGELIGGSWDQADELNAACEAWGTDESSQ